MEALQAVEGVGEVGAAMIKDELPTNEVPHIDRTTSFPRSYQTDEAELGRLTYLLLS